ncbi:MAG: MFS transporter [Nocardioidaceae bacterium]|nr:MFS transporter [Nocardioidaceae bacterium]
MTASDTLLRKGSPEYRRTSAVLFVAGFMTFAILYVAQGTMPAVSEDFGVSPAVASLTLSLTTLPLAVMLVVMASWSEGHGRRRLLVGSLIGAAALTLAAAASPSFPVLLTLRVLTGITLAGFPAVAMAYVAEEFHPSGLGTAMGMYVSGTGLGGMTGRLTGGLLAGLGSWRLAMATVAVVCLVAAIWVAARLPSSRNFVASPGGLGTRIALIRHPLRDPVVLKLALCGFVIMGSLVSYYNYLQYRLAAPPFGLGAVVISLIFAFYLFGTVSANWMGRLADVRSRRGVMLLGFAIMAVGAAGSLVDVLPVVLAATALLVFGFFGTHAVASGFVGTWAAEQRAQASALYLFGYHLGSGVVGYVSGLFFTRFGWSGEVATVLVLVVVGGVVALSLPTATNRR